MSPKYWVSSEDLSADSSLEGSQSRSRDHSDDEEGKHEDGGVSTAEGSIPRGSNDRAVAGPLGTDVTLPRLPNLQPQQHATLFYLSLIEGRCRTQAANTINAGCSPENAVPEDHPQVLGLAQHLFDEMRSELVRAGLLSEDFAAQTLPELRNYLDSFDNLLQNIATQRNFNLSAQQHHHRALPRFESSSTHSDIVPYNPGRFVLPPSSHQQNRQTGPLFESSLFNSDFVPYNPGPLAIMAPREQQLQRSPLSNLSLFFPKVQGTTLGRTLYASDYEQ
jgi:translation initiation factor 2-alpha kinase 3